ncbi:MAG: MliC family protein [Gammaproteobacteria bacterium]
MTVFILLLVSLLSGCSLFWDNDNRWVYECPDGYRFEATFDHGGDSVLFKQDDKKIRLDRVEAASGGKYSDGFTTLWTKGTGAQVIYNDEVIHANCSGDRVGT